MIRIAVHGCHGSKLPALEGLVDERIVYAIPDRRIKAQLEDNITIAIYPYYSLGSNRIIRSFRPPARSLLFIVHTRRFYSALFLYELLHILIYRHLWAFVALLSSVTRTFYIMASRSSSVIVFFAAMGGRRGE